MSCSQEDSEQNQLLHHRKHTRRKHHRNFSQEPPHISYESTNDEGCVSDGTKSNLRNTKFTSSANAQLNSNYDNHHFLVESHRPNFQEEEQHNMHDEHYSHGPEQDLPVDDQYHNHRHHAHMRPIRQEPGRLRPRSHASHHSHHHSGLGTARHRHRHSSNEYSENQPEYYPDLLANYPGEDIYPDQTRNCFSSQDQHLDFENAGLLPIENFSSASFLNPEQIQASIANYKSLKRQQNVDEYWRGSGKLMKS